MHGCCHAAAAAGERVLSCRRTEKFLPSQALHVPALITYIETLGHETDFTRGLSVFRRETRPSGSEQEQKKKKKSNAIPTRAMLQDDCMPLAPSNMPTMPAPLL